MTKFKTVWAIWTILSLIGVIVFIILQPSSKKICIQQFEKERLISYDGVVKAKYLDSTEHYYRTVVLNDSQFLLMNWDESGLYDFIQTKDSIVKNSGSYEVMLFRDSMKYTFTIDYGCGNMAQKVKN